MSDQVAIDERIHRLVDARGITPMELAERSSFRAPADELERWLLAERLAERTPGGLVATGLGRELGVSIRLK